MYINARYDMDTRKLQIFATDRLAEYEQHEIAEAIRLTVMLACTSGGPKRFLFEQPLDEANNHAPVFGQSLYEFSVMLPLPRGFDLSFFQEVSARDLDIRNNKVHFTSRDAQGITVGTAQRVGNDGKTFYAALVTTNQLLTVGEQLAFSITATVSDDDDAHSRQSQSNDIIAITGQWETRTQCGSGDCDTSECGGRVHSSAAVCAGFLSWSAGQQPTTRPGIACNYGEHMERESDANNDRP